jgi:hypothetical protein
VVDDIAGFVGAHGVERLIDFAEAEVGFNRLALVIDGEHIEAAFFAGKDTLACWAWLLSVSVRSTAGL